MSKLWNSVEVFQLYEGAGGDKMQRKQLIKRMTTHFGEDLVILSARELANVLVFKSKAPKLLDLVDNKEDEGIDTAVSMVAKAPRGAGATPFPLVPSLLRLLLFFTFPFSLWL